MTFLENVNTNMHLITWRQPRKDIFTALYLKGVHYAALPERSEPAECSAHASLLRD